ncbi:19233_t:CDS:2, partial [Funneliformis geosporum]
ESFIPAGRLAHSSVLVERKLYFFGGLDDSIHTFNPKTSQWKTSLIKEKGPERCRNIHVVADNVGKIYIFGGETDENLGSENIHLINDMIILNINKVTLISDGRIVFIRGREQTDNIIKNVVDMNQINIYDTKLSSWSTVVSSKGNTSIESRFCHSAVLARNGRIISYGGVRDTAEFLDVKATPDLVVLNTRTTPFEWTVPQISSNAGNMTQTSATLLANKNSIIYLLDIRNYTWVNRFDPDLAYSNQTLLDPNASIDTESLPDRSNLMGPITGILSGIVIVTIFNGTYN